MFVGEDTLLPGVVYWQRTLKRENYLPSKHMTRFQIASVQYGDKDFFVADAFSDALGFHLGLLTDAGKTWVDQILTEIRIVDELAQRAWILGAHIEQAAGGGGDALGNQMKEQLYDRIDIPFRRFLASVDPADDDGQRRDRLDKWRQEARGITLALGREAAHQAGQASFVGRTIENRKKKEKHHYSLPEAYNQFLSQVNKLLRDT